MNIKYFLCLLAIGSTMAMVDQEPRNFFTLKKTVSDFRGLLSSSNITREELCELARISKKENGFTPSMVYDRFFYKQLGLSVLDFGSAVVITGTLFYVPLR